MSAIIRKSGYSYTWICKVMVPTVGSKRKIPCNLTDIAATEEDARAAYEAHKRRAPGH